MRKLLLMAAALCAAVTGLAAGSVSESITQLGTTGTYVITFAWTGDASNGSLPVTPATGTCNGTTFVCTNIQGPLNLAGLAALSVETDPGSPAPTNGYSVTLLDISGADILGGAAASASSTLSQAWSPAATAPPLTNSGLSLAITGNSVASAKGLVYVFLAPLGTVWSRSPGSGGGSGGTVAWGSIIGTLNSQTDLATAIASRNTTGNAGTATALASVPTQCSGGTPFATGVQANGNANCGTPAGGGGVAVCSASNSGSPNTLTCTPSSFTLATGVLINLFVTTATTSTTVTLNVNGGGAVTVMRGTGNAPAIGQIGPSAEPLLLSYNGTAYQIVNDSFEPGATNCLAAARTSFPWTIDINTGCVPELSAANVWTGLNSWPSSSAQTLTSSSAILANGNNVQITAAGIITLTSTPTIAAASGDGTEVTITNTGSNAITLQDKASLSGSLLSLGGTNIAIATGQSLTLRFNSTLGYWVKCVSPGGGSSVSSAAPYLVIGSNSYIPSLGMMQASLPDALTWSSWGSPTVTTSNHSLILDVANSSTDLWSGQTAAVGASPSFELAYSAVIPDENNSAMHTCGMGGFDGTNYFGIFLVTGGLPGGSVVAGHTVGTTNGLGQDHGANFAVDPTQIHDFRISAANFTSGNWVFEVGDGLGKFTKIFSGNITGGIGTVTNWFYGCENNSGGTSANAGHLFMNVVHVAD